MPDISMCSIAFDKCNRARSCYRRMTRPDPHWQTYSVYTGDQDKSQCPSYWPLKAGDDLDPKTAKEAIFDKHIKKSNVIKKDKLKEIFTTSDFVKENKRKKK